MTVCSLAQGQFVNIQSTNKNKAVAHHTTVLLYKRNKIHGKTVQNNKIQAFLPSYNLILWVLAKSWDVKKKMIKY